MEREKIEGRWGKFVREEGLETRGEGRVRGRTNERRGLGESEE